MTEIKPSGWQTPALKSVREDLGWKTGPALYLRERGIVHRCSFPSETIRKQLGTDGISATSPSDSAQVKAIMEAYRERGGRPPTIGKPLPATEEAVDLNPGIRFLIYRSIRWGVDMRVQCRPSTGVT